ncbi:anthranilate synthase component I family protein [Actinomadura verrucosospora]|uniref:Anthranilate synthase C aminase component n=1 Tax=Actinomadura verrucosospora TaxID=46165 RepID=A0A7D3VU38_ACTVE|nr:anthranilate synthase component I family protein [Actinomadura verrucosospora]QKG19896.1 Anthranilate synthase C aminase component [Actinomadura verrucosospora]
MAERIRVTAQRVALPGLDALAATLALRARLGADQVYLLESAGGPAGDRTADVIGFGELLTVSVADGAVRVTGAAEVRARVRDAVAPLLDGGRLRDRTRLWDLVRCVEDVFDAPESADRFAFGLLGFFGYDVARYIEELPYLIGDGPDLPDLQLVLYQGVVQTDLETGAAELALYRSPAWSERALDETEIAGLVRDAPAVTGEPEIAAAPAVLHDDTDRATYLGRVERCLKHIAIGDIYQVQVGHELTIASDADPVAVYRRLRARNASPYSYLVPIAGHTLIGASPELFVRVRGGEVVMRPIAGTAPRGALPDEDLAARLAGSEKEVAEHVMLVDLCRNDIGRICARDTLEVREDIVVERYSHVLHLVSTVAGRLAAGVDAMDVVAALFPAGTMTGAPKIRAMEIIEETESRRRGMYAGAVGLLGRGGYLNLALCIRTLDHHDGEYRTRASAGVVADSRPEAEWTETLAKSAAAYWAVTGKELL